jgi:hypothetical protein
VKKARRIEMNTTHDAGKGQGKRRGCLGRVAIGLLVFLAIALTAGAIYQADASASDLKRYPPPGELYNVGATGFICTARGKAVPP